MHVTNLKKLVPLWFDLSVKMKADREADGAFGVGSLDLVLTVYSLTVYLLTVYLLSTECLLNAYSPCAGWMLEMWGYSVAALRVGVKHFAWQQLQIEPSAAYATQGSNPGLAGPRQVGHVCPSPSALLPVSLSA